MADLEWHEAKTPSPAAVKCGRVVFCIVGAMLILIPIIFSYGSPSENVLLASVCIGVGMLLVILGLTLPPKVVAHFGFWLPAFLPDD